jgi:hypothetical protein
VPMMADFFGPTPLPQDRVGFFSFSRRTTSVGLGASGPCQEAPCVSAQLPISAAFAVVLATLPLSTARAQSYPPPSYPPPPPSYLPGSPFPLEWPFCAVGVLLTTVAIIITAPLRALTRVPPFYYGSGRRPITHRGLTRRRTITRHTETPVFTALAWQGP